MIVERTAAAAFTLEFESEEELQSEHGINLVHGALRIPTAEAIPLYSAMGVTLRGPWGGEASLRATVVAALPDGIALGIEGYTDETLALLLTRPPEIAAAAPVADEPAEVGEDRGETRQTAWDRIRGLPQAQKIILAVKAERTDRALLAQDNDPRVLLSLLRNPRITADEIARLAKSPFMSYQIAEVIMKSPQWMANPEVRIGLVNNPKTPQAFALRLLPTLPEPEVRAIARAGTSMALKQAAMRRLQGKG
ncbi:MAG: hypothetical protein ACSLFQ_14800 [Thermoanaerobaculia bacterium]